MHESLEWAEIDSWRALRRAVAEEFVEKLPARMRMHDLAHLLGLTEEQAWWLVRSGRIRITCDRLGFPEVVPEQNKAVLTEEMLLRFPSPEAGRDKETNGRDSEGACV